MHDQAIALPWEHNSWLEQVAIWVQEQIEQRGWHMAQAIDVVHQRPWSTFARIMTDRGVVYFKAPAPMFAYEAGLTQALSKWRPDCTVPLLAVHLEHGWILSAHAGVTLRQLTRSVEQIPHWLKLLPLYSELQIELANRVPELLALDLPDRRLAHLPQLYAGLLEATDSLCIGSELSPAEYQQLHDGHTRFTAECEALASYNLPETITHEEVHENNVLLGSGRYIFTDWSDSSVSHPFFSMLVTLRATAHWLNLGEQGPELRQMRDAYLEPWTKFETRDKLSSALEIAYRLGMVNRALSWHQGLGRLSPEIREPYADTIPGWLKDYLQAS